MAGYSIQATGFFGTGTRAFINQLVSGGTGGGITTCTPNWQTGSWSTCANGQQIRSVSDSNHCGVTTGQPATTQSCTTTCTPNWQTGSWSTCINGQQTRTVTDTNNCGVTTGQPETVQSCTVACVPNWQTGPWGDCANNQQTRSVTDLNNCGTTAGQPSTTQSCSTVQTTSCPSGLTWNSTNSVCTGDIICPPGMTWDSTAKTCTGAPPCPPGLTLKNINGVWWCAGEKPTCPSGLNLSDDKMSCVGKSGSVGSTCPTGQWPNVYIGACARYILCRQSLFDANTRSCTAVPTCPSGGTVDYSLQSCITILCPAGMTYDASLSKCIAPSQSSLNSNNSCTSSWQTGDWGTCSNGQQTRTVTDTNNCGVTTGQPAVSQSCTPQGPICPSGLTWNSANSVCTGDPKCKTGMTLDYEINACVGGNLCPSGLTPKYINNNWWCAGEKPTCPSGFTLNNNDIKNCIGNISGAPICRTGIYNSTLNKCVSPPTCPTNTLRYIKRYYPIIFTPDGWAYQSKTLSIELWCYSLFDVDDSSYVRGSNYWVTSDCPSELYPQFYNATQGGTNCNKYTPRCQIGTLSSDNQLCIEGDKACPEGLNLDASGNCLARSNSICPSGQWPNIYIGACAKYTLCSNNFVDTNKMLCKEYPVCPYPNGTINYINSNGKSASYSISSYFDPKIKACKTYSCPTGMILNSSLRATDIKCIASPTSNLNILQSILASIFDAVRMVIQKTQGMFSR